MPEAGRVVKLDSFIDVDDALSQGSNGSSSVDAFDDNFGKEKK
jgi:hypothetical protein